ncbi:MAG: M20/M25/M40 family metallo-hydrolase [Erysipelotrichaceae bacterium]|nr:M20/M25/M40 family metallo-hydrolase [Erysipelotrichaceae bacterium]
MKVVLVVLAVLVVLLLIALVRALLMKPTSAKDAKVVLDTSERAEKYGQRLSRMIQKETISCRNQEDRSKFYEFHKLLETEFPLIHEKCEKHDFNGSLLFKWPGHNKAEPVLFMSHQDVVEATGQWKHDPFSGHIDETGRVWGRGTVDTKASLMCMLSAVEEMIESGFAPLGDVYIASSCTEEWGGDGAPATVDYLEKQGVKLSLVIDEGGMIIEKPVGGVNGTYAMIGVVEKGYGDVKFTAKGKGGHSSAPTKNTPLVRLGQFMAYVEKNYPFKSEYTPTVAEMFARFAPNMDFGMKFLFGNMWLFKPLMPVVLPAVSSAAAAMLRTTLAFTMAEGSQGANVLPHEAYVVGNMRFIHHQDDKESIRIISDIAKKFDIEAKALYVDAPWPVVDFKGKQFNLVEEVIHEIYPGIGVSPYVMTGGTDAKFYSRICNHCIRFAPLYIDGQQYGSIHTLNENICSGALPMGVDFYKSVIRKTQA